MPRSLLAATLLFFAGCSVLAGAPVVTLGGAEGFPELPIHLDDPGGLVLSVRAAPRQDGIGATTVKTVDRDTVVLRWTGGACDDRAHIGVFGTAASIQLTVTTDQQLGFGCNAAGIDREVEITFREPLGSRTVTAAGGA